MSEAPFTIHWFRRDIRLADNTALNHALESGASVIPLFIFDPLILAKTSHSAPRMAFLLDALTHLDADLRRQGSRLFIRHGRPLDVFKQISHEIAISAIYANRDYSPYARQRDATLDQLGIPFHLYDDMLLIPPQDLLKSDGQPYVVFTPFKKQWNTLKKAPIWDNVIGRFADVQALVSENIPTLKQLGYSDTIPLPQASEQRAIQRLNAFLQADIYRYDTDRNLLPNTPFSDERTAGSSYLSPYLRFGLLSPRQCYWGARTAYEQGTDPRARQSVATWVSELTWRDFYAHILYHFPHVAQENFKKEYNTMEWHNASNALSAWKEGMTGYPIVDAAMRQLKAIGWMPNRARMIVASFLTKDLLIHWREGEKHFMDWLIDGDLAANNGGWQWAAGTGTDAQPYFRIFNPVSQSQQFDPNGDYIRHWVPELRGFPARDIHAPWIANRTAQYPPPIVDHHLARQQALAAFKKVKATS